MVAGGAGAKEGARDGARDGQNELIVRTYRAFGYARTPSKKTQSMFEETLAGKELVGKVHMVDDAERAITLYEIVTDVPL